MTDKERIEQPKQLIDRIKKNLEEFSYWTLTNGEVFISKKTLVSFLDSILKENKEE